MISDEWPSDDDRPPTSETSRGITYTLKLENLTLADLTDAIPADNLSRPANPDQPWPYTSF